jgi:hypothetical protein
LDAKCISGDDTHIDIEVQQADNDDYQSRVRYNGVVIITNAVNPGITFDEIPNVYEINITTFDVFSGGFLIYHVERVVRKIGNTVENGFEEVYVNILHFTEINLKSKQICSKQPNYACLFLLIIYNVIKMIKKS